MAQTMKARPTTYKGINMRSRLEAGFAQWLDRWGLVWEYEPQCFASERGQYLPDFGLLEVPVVTTDATGPIIERQDIYVECKPPTVQTFDNLEAIAERMTTVWESELSAGLLVAVPTTLPDHSGLWWVALQSDGLALVESRWVALRGGGVVLAPCALPVSFGPWQGEWWKG